MVIRTPQAGGTKPFTACMLLLCLAAACRATPDSSPPTEAASTEAPTECAVSFDPQVVNTAEGSVLVHAHLGRTVGELQEIVMEEGSGIGVVDGGLMSPTVVKLSLLSDGSNAGTWTVTITGDDGICTGRIFAQNDWSGEDG